MTYLLKINLLNTIFLLKTKFVSSYFFYKNIEEKIKILTYYYNGLKNKKEGDLLIKEYLQKIKENI